MIVDRSVDWRWFFVDIKYAFISKYTLQHEFCISALWNHCKNIFVKREKKKSKKKKTQYTAYHNAQCDGFNNRNRVFCLLLFFLVIFHHFFLFCFVVFSFSIFFPLTFTSSSTWSWLLLSWPMLMNMHVIFQLDPMEFYLSTQWDHSTLLHFIRY